MSDDERQFVPPEEAKKDQEGEPRGAGLEQEIGGGPGGADEAFQEELQNLQQEITKFKELYLRKLADFDNYRKRQEREMVEFRRYANADLIRDCLPVLDNLERALAVPGGAGGGLREGVELVLKLFRDTLGRHGLSEIDPIEQPFDPAVHEAIQRHEVSGVEDATVVQVLQKGYRLGERLIRPALVIVAVPSGAGESTDNERTTEGSHGQDHRN
jgi:molecular chaperone GrpE